MEKSHTAQHGGDDLVRAELRVIFMDNPEWDRNGESDEDGEWYNLQKLQ